MPTPRVLFIGAARHPITGGEKYAAVIIEHLRGAGLSVEVVTPDDLPAPIRRRPMAVNRWLLERHAGSLQEMTIIEDYSWHPRTFLFNWSARRRGAGLICVVHHVTHRLRSRLWQRLTDYLMGAAGLAVAQRVIVNSRSTSDDVARLGVRRSRISILPPAVERPARVERTSGGGGLRLLAVGNVYPRKGLHVLVEALGAVALPFHLEVVGEADYEPDYAGRLAERIRESRLEDRIVFRGRLDGPGLDAAYRSADVFVAPSLWEGFGMAVLEALLYGLPVVATRVGAIPELIEDERNGLLVPPNDAAALAGALGRLASDPALRARLSAGARESGERRAGSWDQVGQKALELVGELSGSALG